MWQAGSVGYQVEQRDLSAMTSRHRDGGRQILLHRIIEVHFTAFDHVLQQQTGKWLGDGSDIEKGVTVDILVGAVIHFPSADDSAAVLVDNSDYNADVAFFNLDAPLQ